MELTEQEQKFYKLIMEDFEFFPKTYSLTSPRPEVIAAIIAVQIVSIAKAIGTELDMTNMVVNKLSEASQQDKERIDLLEARVKQLEEKL